MENDSLMISFQICDTAFPSGSLANSVGLESAIAHGIVSKTADDDANFSSLISFFRMTLEQAAYQSLPFVRAAHEASLIQGDGEICFLDSLKEICEICDAMTMNEVVRRSSLNQGKCFLRAASIAFAHSKRASELDAIALLISLPLSGQPGPMSGHHAPIFGAACGILGLSASLTERIYMRCILRDLASCAARLNVLGPLEGAGLQARLGSTMVEVLLAAKRSSSTSHVSEECGYYKSSIARKLLGVDMPAQRSPILDTVQARHDLLYARLFNS